MKSLFRPYLVNEPYKDPALYIELFGRKECYLFDLGDISRLSTRKILKISRIFITHTHVDHFFGFDTVLRLFLGRSEPLHIYGPKNITKNVKGKISGYTWNLIKEYPLNIYVHEIDKDKVSITLFSAKNGLKPVKIGESNINNSIIFEDKELCIKTLKLNHKIPVLSYQIEEKIRINVRKDMLKELALTPGPWLNTLKNQYLSGKMPQYIELDSNGEKKVFLAEELTKKLLLIKEGEKILYITDIRFSNRDLDKIAKFSTNPDFLFCEAFFLTDDIERAKDRHHLTASQTNIIAKKLNAKKLIIFHFSPRYKGNFKKIYNEAYEGLNKE